jgi:XisI protein
MDKLTNYQQAIQQILTEYASYMPVNEGLTLETIFDETRDHFQLVVLGWNGHEHIYKPLLHLDIINGKIWVQLNETQFTLTEDFDRFEIPHHDIVNGLIPTRRRAFTGYAVG